MNGDIDLESIVAMAGASFDNEPDSGPDSEDPSLGSDNSGHTSPSASTSEDVPLSLFPPSPATRALLLPKRSAPKFPPGLGFDSSDSPVKLVDKRAAETTPHQHTGVWSRQPAMNGHNGSHGSHGIETNHYMDIFNPLPRRASWLQAPTMATHECPESAARAVVRYPEEYGAHEPSDSSCLNAAITLAHAHCLLYDIAAADSRFAGDGTYAGLLSRYLAEVAPAPGVVSAIADLDLRSKNTVGVPCLPPLSYRLGSPLLTSGFALGLSASAIEIRDEQGRRQHELQLLAPMTEHGLVWSMTQDTLGDSWYPWFIIEANGLCASVAHAQVRLFSGMRLALGMMNHLYGIASNLSAFGCTKSTHQSRQVYGLQTIGALWQVWSITVEDGEYPVRLIWAGNVSDPHQMARAFLLIREIAAEGKMRMELITDWLSHVLGKSQPPPKPASHNAPELLAPQPRQPAPAILLSAEAMPFPLPATPPLAQLSASTATSTSVSPSSVSPAPSSQPLKPTAATFTPKKNRVRGSLAVVTDIPRTTDQPLTASARSTTSVQAAQHLHNYNFGAPYQAPQYQFPQQTFQYPQQAYPRSFQMYGYQAQYPNVGYVGPAPNGGTARPRHIAAAAPPPYSAGRHPHSQPQTPGYPPLNGRVREGRDFRGRHNSCT